MNTYLLLYREAQSPKTGRLELNYINTLGPVGRKWLFQSPKAGRLELNSLNNALKIDNEL